MWTNSAAQLAAALTARASRAAALLVAARLLGPAPFGTLAVALAAYELLRVASEAGLDTRLIRRVARSPARGAVETVRTARLKITLAAILILAALGPVLLLLGSGDALLFAAIAAGAIGFAVSGSAQALATGRLDAPRLLPLQAATGILFLVLVVTASAIWRAPLATATAIGLADLAAGWLLLRYVERSHVPGTMAGVWSWRAALREAWPVAGVNILATTYGRLGLAVLAFAWGSSAVAQYGVSARTVEVFLLASAAVAGSALAVSSRLSAESPEGSRALLDRLLAHPRSAALTLGVAVLVAAAASLLPLVLGAGYAAAVPTTRVLAFALPPMFLNGLLTAHLYAEGRFHTVLRIAIVNLVLNAALVFWLVPRYGPIGAACAVTATESANTLWQGRAIGFGWRSWPYAVAGVSLVAAGVGMLLALR
ncbi:MAG: polysaccharide biosynthesis C-terminal domain-containing protein [Gemmatimonadales bacterium]